MILITVGTERFPFNRLMNWIRVLIKQGFIQEEIVVQYGSCTDYPSGVKAYSLVTQNQFQELIQQARLIIGHCGEGTFLHLGSTAKPYILVPRSQRFKEHVDDHQIELAVALAQIDIPIAWSPGDLVRFLALPREVPSAAVSATSLCKRLKNRFG
jgi:UDP-N-acetylglucosamine transferase subunit ALG13